MFSLNGQLIRTVKQVAPKENGINRWTWDMAERGVNNPSRKKIDPKSPEPTGLNVLPGKYKIRFSFGGSKDSIYVLVKYDPRVRYESGALEAQYKMLKELLNLTRLAAEATEQLADASQTIELLETSFKERNDVDFKAIKDKSKALKDSINNYFDLILGKKIDQGFSGGKVASLSTFLSVPSFYIPSSVKPGSSEERVMDQARIKLNIFLLKFNKFFEIEWKAHQVLVEKQKWSAFKGYSPLKN